MTIKYTSTNPTTEKTLQTFEYHTSQEINKKLENSLTSFCEWRSLSFQSRAEYLNKISELLEEKKETFAILMTTEMGKPFQDGISEVEKCSLACKYYAKNTENLVQREEIQMYKQSKAQLSFHPIGTILAIMPWNFPLWQVFRFAAPSLMSGNVCILKHAPNMPQTALDIEKLFIDSGAPKGIFQNLFADNFQIESIIKDNRISGVSLTGSTIAGSEVASIAGRHLKPIVLELGGSDPFIVLEDADLKKAAQVAASAKCFNSGQVCLAPKRFIIDKKVYSEFSSLLIQNLEAIKLGDPIKKETQMGPIARKDLFTNLQNQIDRAKKMGAQQIWKKEIDFEKGYFFAPMVFEDIPENNPLLTEEIFGPIAPLIAFTTESEAISIANNSKFGLGASIWSKDTEKALRLSNQINVGLAAINAPVTSDIATPIGGMKSSGYGKELGKAGVRQFMNLKAAWIG